MIRVPIVCDKNLTKQQVSHQVNKARQLTNCFVIQTLSCIRILHVTIIVLTDTHLPLETTSACRKTSHIECDQIDAIMN